MHNINIPDMYKTWVLANAELDRPLDYFISSIESSKKLIKILFNPIAFLLAYPAVMSRDCLNTIEHNMKVIMHMTKPKKDEHAIINKW